MWIVCDAGFFNIICQDDDAEKGLLTVKSRSIKELEYLENFAIFPPDLPIEESDVTDYRFRRKMPRDRAVRLFTTFIQDINYPKTKPKLMERNPDRTDIYLRVWADLYAIQEIDER